MFGVRKRSIHLVLITAIFATLTLPEGITSQEANSLTANGTGTKEIDYEKVGRSLLGALGSTLGSLLGTGASAPAEEVEEEDEEEVTTEPTKPKKIKKKKKKPDETATAAPAEETNILSALFSGGGDDSAPDTTEVPRKKIIRKGTRSTTTEATLELPAIPKKKHLRPKYVDDDEELTETDKDWLTGLMGDAKEEQARFEKELIAEILQHAKETEAEGDATMGSVSKKVQGYLAKLRDTARDKGEDLYDKTRQLFSVLVGHARQEGPVVMKKVKIYVSKVLAARNDANGEKSPLSDEDKAFLASLMAGVKWGDEEPGATPAPSIPVITSAPYIPTQTLAPYVPPETTPYIPPALIPSANDVPTAAPVAPPPSSSGGNFEQDALKAHNDLRAKHGAPPLTISAELTNVAQAWASNLARIGKMRHSSTDYGENIFVSVKPDVTDGKEPVEKWYAEVKDFNWNCLDCTFEKTGHFTQVIWVETKEVGIAKASGPTGTYVVANYNPAGNTEGTYATNTLPIR